MHNAVYCNLLQQTPTSTIIESLDQARSLYYEIMESICSSLDNVEPAIINYLPRKLAEAQCLRFLLLVLVLLC